MLYSCIHMATLGIKGLSIKQNLKSNNLSLNEATVVAQNRPLWKLMFTFGAVHS